MTLGKKRELLRADAVETWVSLDFRINKVLDFSDGELEALENAAAGRNLIVK